MASYATVAQLRKYLKQASAVADADLQEVLDRATAIVDRALGFSFAAYPAAAVKYVRGRGGPYLFLPPHEAGSITLVTLSGSTITEWEELGTMLYKVGSTGGEGDWGTSRYSVTSKWGAGPAPLDIEEVTLEVTVNIWRAKDAARFSDVVGVAGGGAVGYEGSFTKQQKFILAQTRYRVQGIPA